MKYIEEFRNPELAQKLADKIRLEAQKGDRTYRFMEFCGGHTHAIYRFGLPDLLPENVQMIHGPGCPVCVLPMSRVDMAIKIAKQPGITLFSYGDMMRVPGSRRQSLLKAKADGADVRMATSPYDALRFALENPQKTVVFFAIGFETTTPPTASVIMEAHELRLKNFLVFCNHILTPAAFGWLLEAEKSGGEKAPKLDGFIGPAHVSAIIGTIPYETAAKQYGKPVVIAGFEPLDIMQAILMLVKQVNENRAEVENEYTRAVSREGNIKAQKLMERVFEKRETFEWRGLGFIEKSGLRLRLEFAEFDAEEKIGVEAEEAKENSACQCPAILRGVKKPTDCLLFGKACSPENPLGACMVSSEGACAAWYRYKAR